METELAAKARSVDRAPRTPASGADVLASIFVAFNLAIAQPVLDVIGRNAEFLVAQGAPNSDIVMLAVGATMIAPLAIGVILLGMRALHRPTGNVAHLMVLGGLLALFVLQIEKRVIDGSGIVLMAVATVGGLLLAAMVRRSSAFRRVTRIMWPIGVLVAALFLLTGGVAKIIMPHSTPVRPAAAVIEPAPIVMLVLDEFPVASLMDLDGNVDARLYPSLARLGREGTWYRNAATQHDYTERSVPSILSGRMGSNDKVPVVADYPVNLFTLLSGRYRYHVAENVTLLCPSAICAGKDSVPVPRQPVLRRWISLASDVRWISLRVLLPDDVSDRFPAIDQQWGDFGGDGAAPARHANVRNRAATFTDFIAHLEPSAKPTIHFLHSMLPHPPWTYVRTGQEYDAPGVAAGQAQGRPWKDDQWLADLSYQRHLEQVRYTDSLIGKMLQKLDDEGLYDDALIVVTSDHGASFDANYGRRGFAPQLAGGIGAVPLFIKTPHQAQGGVDDRPAGLIDVLPTIADAIGMRQPDPWEGISLLRSNFPTDRERTILTSYGTLFPIRADGSEKNRVVRFKYDLFGVRNGSIDVFAMGPYRSLVGTRPSAGSDASATVCLDDPGAYRSTDPSATRIPVLVTGRAGDLPRSWLAVSVDGTIRSVTRTFHEKGSWRFEAFIPARSLRAGSNDLAIHLVQGAQPSPSLHGVRIAC